MGYVHKYLRQGQIHPRNLYLPALCGLFPAMAPASQDLLLPFVCCWVLFFFFLWVMWTFSCWGAFQGGWLSEALMICVKIWCLARGPESGKLRQHETQHTAHLPTLPRLAASSNLCAAASTLLLVPRRVRWRFAWLFLHYAEADFQHTLTSPVTLLTHVSTSQYFFLSASSRQNGARTTQGSGATHRSSGRDKLKVPRDVVLVCFF